MTASGSEGDSPRHRRFRRHRRHRRPADRPSLFRPRRHLHLRLLSGRNGEAGKPGRCLPELLHRADRIAEDLRPVEAEDKERTGKKTNRPGIFLPLIPIFLQTVKSDLGEEKSKGQKKLRTHFCSSNLLEFQCGGKIKAPDSVDGFDLSLKKPNLLRTRFLSLFVIGDVHSCFPYIRHTSKDHQGTFPFQISRKSRRVQIHRNT